MAYKIKRYGKIRQNSCIYEQERKKKKKEKDGRQTKIEKQACTHLAQGHTLNPDIDLNQPSIVY